MKTLLFSTAEVYTCKPTGGIRRFRELTEYLHKTSDITVCSMDSSNVMSEHGIMHHVHMQTEKTRDLYKLLPPIFKIFFTNNNIISELRKRNFDKVVAFDIPPVLGLILWGYKNITMLIRKDLIGYEIVTNKSFFLFKYAKITLQWFWELICILNVEKIIFQCYYDKNVMKSRHPMLSSIIERKAKIQINNVNPSWIVEKSKEVENGYSLGEHVRFRVCFIGGFDDSRKGQDFFLETAEKLLQTKEGIDFFLVGGGKSLQEYQKRYANDHIKFCGRMENPLTVLKQCDLLIVPSLADSCPNTVMEALYNDVLVLGSKRGGIPEILIDESSLFDFDTRLLNCKILNIRNNIAVCNNLREIQRKRKDDLIFCWAEKIAKLL